MGAIILEGTDGVGKSAVAAELARLVPLCETVKLSGGPKGTPSSYQRDKFQFWADYLRLCHLNTVIMDRGPMSERVYGPLKGYAPEELSYLDAVEQKLSWYGARLVLLTASPSELERRLHGKLLQNPNERHPDISKACELQERYVAACAQQHIRQFYMLETDGRTPRELAEAVIDWAQLLLAREGVL